MFSGISRIKTLLDTMARPKKEINWEVVEKRMEAGCSAKEIAGALHVEINTFYDRFKEEFGLGFADFADKFYDGGDANIRYTQYMKALSGNVNMLLWLGKLRLGQKEPDVSSLNPVNQPDIDKDHYIMQLEHEIAQFRGQSVGGK
jgi:AraC-like DNA-binding protein